MVSLFHSHIMGTFPAMLNTTRLRRLSGLALLALAVLLAAADVQAQSFRPYRGGGFSDGPPPRGRPDGGPPRSFDDPDQAANAARRATGGRVLGVQGANGDQPGYRVRILERDGRVRNFHYDPASGAMRD
jgi:hypothetical protein